VRSRRAAELREALPIPKTELSPARREERARGDSVRRGGGSVPLSNLAGRTFLRYYDEGSVGGEMRKAADQDLAHA